MYPLLNNTDVFLFLFVVAGATKQRLKEAQSINKSLSALGDVISCLSTAAKFIPYRNNKLTMLLSDGLGGNAKTLMFVNLSPADVSYSLCCCFELFMSLVLWFVFFILWIDLISLPSFYFVNSTTHRKLRHLWSTRLVSN